LNAPASPPEVDKSSLAAMRRDLRELTYSLEFVHDDRFGLLRHDIGDACRALSRVDTGPLPLSYEVTELDAHDVLTQMRQIRDALETTVLAATDGPFILQVGGALHGLSRGIAHLVISIARSSAK
jgi:hypothetical protein